MVTTLKSLKNIWDAEEAFTMRKSLIYVSQKGLLTGDKKKQPYLVLQPKNSQWKHLCGTKGGINCCDSLWCSGVDSWTVDMKTRPLAKRYVVIHTNNVLCIDGLSTVWTF